MNDHFVFAIHKKCTFLQIEVPGETKIPLKVSDETTHKRLDFEQAEITTQEEDLNIDIDIDIKEEDQEATSANTLPVSSKVENW